MILTTTTARRSTAFLCAALPLLTTLCALTLAPSCCSHQQGGVSVPPYTVPHEPHAASTVKVEFLSGLVRADGHYTIMVRLTNMSHDYPHLVQVLQMEGGELLVEGFQVSAGGHHIYDQHAGRGWRRMTVWACEIATPDWSVDGFCHLPLSPTGFEETSVGLDFNASYQRRHPRPWTGRVVRWDTVGYAAWWITPGTNEHQTPEVEVWCGDSIAHVATPGRR